MLTFTPIFSYFSGITFCLIPWYFVPNIFPNSVPPFLRTFLQSSILRFSLLSFCLVRCYFSGFFPLHDCYLTSIMFCPVPCNLFFHLSLLSYSVRASFVAYFLHLFHASLAAYTHLHLLAIFLAYFIT